MGEDELVCWREDEKKEKAYEKRSFEDDVVRHRKIIADDARFQSSHGEVTFVSNCPSSVITSACHADYERGWGTRCKARR
jgi:hypothetical protein